MSFVEEAVTQDEPGAVGELDVDAGRKIAQGSGRVGVSRPVDDVADARDHLELLLVEVREEKVEPPVARVDVADHGDAVGPPSHPGGIGMAGGSDETLASGTDVSRACP
jgi:hypothetical protein